MYQLIKQDGKAKRGRLTTVHGVIETPVFISLKPDPNLLFCHCVTSFVYYQLVD